MAEAGQEDPPEGSKLGKDRPEEWDWLSRRLIETLHAETLSRFGGTAGLREEGLLESAFAAPKHLSRYGDPSVWELAAAYCEGLLQNHPFADGNKRTGLLAARAFLFKNGYRLEPEEVETVAVIRRVAAGEIGREELAEWLEASSEPVSEA
jgi:death-on-curing protein